MTDAALDQVIVTESYEDGAPAETCHQDVALLVVQDNELHVWFEGTHYVGQGTASTVSEGDWFIQLQPELTLFQVLAIDDSQPASAGGVEIRWFYGPLLDAEETRRDLMSLNALTGDIENPAMGDPGPPILLAEC